MQLGKVSRWQILTAKLCQVRSIPICEKSLYAVCQQIIILCSANWKAHSRSRLVHNLKPTSLNNCCSARLFFSGKKNFLFNFFDHATVIVPHNTKPKGFVAGNLSHGEPRPVKNFVTAWNTIHRIITFYEEKISVDYEQRLLRKQNGSRG